MTVVVDVVESKEDEHDSAWMHEMVEETVYEAEVK